MLHFQNALLSNVPVFKCLHFQSYKCGRKVKTHLNVWVFIWKHISVDTTLVQKTAVNDSNVHWSNIALYIPPLLNQHRMKSRFKGKVRSKYEVCLYDRTSYQKFRGVVNFSVRHMLSPLSKAKDVTFTVFLVSAKRHFHNLSRSKTRSWQIMSFRMNLSIWYFDTK